MSREQVRSFDDWAINTLKIAGVVLMENAGRSCAELIKSELDSVENPAVCIFCGKGNNGGDGYVIARHLLNSGFDVRVVLVGKIAEVRGDAKANLDLLLKLGLEINELDINGADVRKCAAATAQGADMVVDAVFGTGLRGQLNPEYKELIGAINQCSCPILAVDIPSGLDCDTGKPLEAAVKAKYTVTFGAMKKGFAGEEAKPCLGRVSVASIGVDPAFFKAYINLG